MDDNKIIELYQARDELAIKNTSDKYGKYCYAIAFNILSDDGECEECLDDTWLCTWNSIPPVVPQCLRSFVAKITRNLSRDRFRKKNRQKRVPDSMTMALEELDSFLEGTVSAEDDTVRRELAGVIDMFLRSLPERECNIFLRRYYFVDSISEIAKRYSIKESNVYAILSRTRAKLREQLQKEGYTV